MSLQSNNRDFAESGSHDSRDDYQRFEHDPLDLVIFAPDETSPVVPFGKTYNASARIYCPDIRVVSRIACTFKPLYADQHTLYDLSTTNNTIVAYRCINDGARVVRVGEIVGKNGIPLAFPKSNIDGIAFQTDEDMPWIDVDMVLGFPGVAGKWILHYHATSNNKLKKKEWEGYISRVTMSREDGPSKPILFGLPT